jgi:hypothetical protein
MLVCVSLHIFAHETVGAARTRHSLRPLFSKGENFLHGSGASRCERLTHVCFALTLNPEVRRDGSWLDP